MSPALQPAASDNSDASSSQPATETTPSNHSPQQQSAGMAYGSTPQNNAYEQGQSNGEEQNSANNAVTGGGRLRRRSHRRSRRRSVKSRKGKRSRRGGRRTKRRSSRRLRHKKSRKGKKSKKSKKGMRGGGACGAGMVLAEVGHAIYPDRGGGDQTVAAQTELAQKNSMDMHAQSKLDAEVPNP